METQSMIPQFSFNPYPRRAFAIALAALLVFATGSGVAQAQSGTRNATSARKGATTTSQSGSQSRNAASKVALEGYCPVCVIRLKKWVRGKPEYNATYDGKTYYFPGYEQKEMFLADPVKYVPAFGGDCTVCFANMEKRVPGTIHQATLHDNRLFLFPNEDQKQEFRKNPAKYANVDLALGGICSVCRVELKQNVAGKPEIATIHQGLRYRFPSEQQKKMFLANPAKYAVESVANAK